MLNGHVQVPHLTNAQKDRYSALFKDVDVGAAWRSRMIPEVQSPAYLGVSPFATCEFGLGRDVLIGDEVFHGFDGLCKNAGLLPMDLVHPLSRIA